MNASTFHIAAIMDGNGRWAQQRGRPRFEGHVEGAVAVRRIVEAATRDPRVEVLTLYAFSAENWKRPRGEVQVLMALFEEHLTGEAERCVENGVRISVIGRRDRLSAGLVGVIEQVERQTRPGRRAGASDRGRYRADRYPSGRCFCPVRRCACAASGGLYRGSGRAGESISS